MTVAAFFTDVYKRQGSPWIPVSLLSCGSILRERKRTYEDVYKRQGEDDEELFEYAMHPAQYEAYKSGKAKEDFLAEMCIRDSSRCTIVIPTMIRMK